VFRRAPRSERGAAAVEFALVMPILILLVFGIIQYGWYFYVAENASGAASNVTRRLAVGDCWSGTQARDYAQAQAPQVTSATASPSTPPADVGDTFTVTVQANANVIDFLPVPDGGVVTRTVTARLEDKDAGTC
jgi:Flp pilus assembly protein TadG